MTKRAFIWDLDGTCWILLMILAGLEEHHNPISFPDRVIAILEAFSVRLVAVAEEIIGCDRT